MRVPMPSFDPRRSTGDAAPIRKRSSRSSHSSLWRTVLVGLAATLLSSSLNARDEHAIANVSADNVTLAQLTPDPNAPGPPGTTEEETAAPSPPVAEPAEGARPRTYGVAATAAIVVMLFVVLILRRRRRRPRRPQTESPDLIGW